MSRNAIAHTFKKLRGPSRCRECDTYVYFHGYECDTVGVVQGVAMFILYLLYRLYMYSSWGVQYYIRWGMYSGQVYTSSGVYSG